MPLFTSSNGQNNANDDIDLQEIFAEYFNEDYSYQPDSLLYSSEQQVQQSHPNSNDLAKQQLAANAAAAVAASFQSGQQLLLPTGYGIKTAFHAGSLPSMQQHYLQQQHHPVKGTTGNQHQVQQPPAKKLKGGEMQLPISQTLTQKQQLGIGTGNLQYNATMAALSQQQQQLALAHAAAGVGGLSSRLGWNLNVPMATNGTAGLGGSIVGVVGGSSSTMAPQQQPPQPQHQPQQIQQPHVVLPTGGLHFPVGMGLKFGVGGITTGGFGSLPVVANREITNNNELTMANNHAAALALAQGGFQVVGSKVNAIHAVNGNNVAVSNIQYSTNPALGFQHRGIKMMQDNMSGEDRRLRNREHAKRSRVRKKFMVESLQQQVRSLQDENSTLRMLVQQHIPEAALSIIDKCCSKSVLFANRGDEIGGDGNNLSHPPSQDQTQLLRSDFSLIESLTSGQQNFVLSDPRLPDNPIVYATPGFYELTGYTREQVLGRNCRFLQGAGTDRRAIDVIRTAVANGTDATVCLMNYKADGTPFWNQLFVAALRDADDCIVNYVSCCIY